jgi:hypothetical protein
MRSTLMSAALAGLLALGALPAAAAEGPGRDIADPRVGATVTFHFGGDGGYQQPGYYGAGGYRDWHNPDSYNRPNWGWGNNPSWGSGNNGWWNGGYHNRQPLPEWTIRNRIHRQNFHDIGRLKMKDGVYRVNAENWRGQDVRLVVDAYTGRVLDVDRR